MSTLESVKDVLGATLGIEQRACSFSAATSLLGDVPELDSIAVLHVILALEKRFGITIADDEIGATEFETVGSLVQFIDRKLDDAAALVSSKRRGDSAA